MTPAQRQQLIALGINPDMSGDIATPNFGMQNQQAQPMQGQQQSQQAQPQFAHPDLHGNQSQPPPWLSAMFAPQQASPVDWKAIGDIVHPPSTHLGMSGEDITGQKGPYDSGGIDWLKSHNDNSGGRVTVDPAAQAQTQSAMMAAFAPQTAQVQHQLPWTTIATAPVGQNPGYGSPEFANYYQRIQRQLQNPFAMLR